MNQTKNNFQEAIKLGLLAGAYLTQRKHHRYGRVVLKA